MFSARILSASLQVYDFFIEIPWSDLCFWPLPSAYQEECQVTVTHTLGIFALAAGGSLLLSEPLLGQDLLTEVTGMHMASLYPWCVVSIMAGAVAMKVGLQEEREFDHPQGANHEE
jgi:hypothetical protein